MIKLFLAFALVLTTLNSSFADNNSTKKEMVTYLESVASVYRTMYAPALWKKEFAQWTLDAEVQSAKDKIDAMETVTVKDFQFVLRDLILSMKDYHVSISFNATERATLPFVIKGSQKRYFFGYIDRVKLPKESFPFEVGDELIMFDGKPVHEQVMQLKSELGNNADKTDQSLAEMRLTARTAASGMIVPKGALDIVVKKEEKELSHQLIWDYKKELISEAPINPKMMDNYTDPVPSIGIKQLDMTSSSALALTANSPDENPYKLGARNSFIPALGKKIWEAAASSHFNAYIYLSDKKELIGYVRIPKYGAGEKESKQFVKIIQKFEKMTDKLVIDQVNNPGGSVFYLYSLVSMLTDKALYTPKHYMAITQEDVLSAVETLEKLEKVTNLEELKKLLGSDTAGGYPISMTFLSFMKDHYQFIIDEWNSGKTLTSPHHMYGVDKINPHPEVNYTKPILLVINELDFSGGDFLPAILQDNKRVKILGTRTAGAGGYVLDMSIPNKFGVKTFRVTGSLADRINHTPIENLGVKPDVAYDLTPEDYQKGFKGYVKQIQDTLDNL